MEKIFHILVTVIRISALLSSYYFNYKLSSIYVEPRLGLISAIGSLFLGFAIIDAFYKASIDE